MTVVITMEGNFTMYTKFHGNLSIYYLVTSIKATNGNLMVMLEEK